MEIGFGKMIEAEKIEEIKKYAEENNIPIMMEDAVSYLKDYIEKHSIHHILEVGTAIGYSAIMMASVDGVHVTTIEKDENRYQQALKNIQKMHLEDKIQLLYQDAQEVELEDTYDLIFIDAAKAQNRKFFERFEKNLKDRGVIVTDNMKFHGLVDKKIEEIESKNLRHMIRKIKDYISFLKENPNYTTEFLDIGDGLAISCKK